MSATRILAATLAATSAALVTPAVTAQAAPLPKPFTIAVGQVTSPTLTIRSHPTTSSARLASFKHHETFNPVCSVVGQSVGGTRTWYWAMGRANGWVSARYVHLTQGTVPACAATPDMHLMNAHVSTAAQVRSQLAGTSASFRAFILAELKEHTSATCRATISVNAWWKGNQAIGDVQDCMGYSALWTYSGGRWHELGTTGVLPCAALRRTGASHTINGNTGWVCSVPSPAGGHGPTFVQYTPRG